MLVFSDKMDFIKKGEKFFSAKDSLITWEKSVYKELRGNFSSCLYSPLNWRTQVRGKFSFIFTDPLGYIDSTEGVAGITDFPKIGLIIPFAQFLSS